LISQFLPARFLGEQVKAAIAAYFTCLNWEPQTLARFLEQQQVTIKPCYPRHGAHYSCAVAFQLASYLNNCFKNLPNNLVDQPQTSNQPTSPPQQSQPPQYLRAIDLINAATPAQIGQGLGDRLAELSLYHDQANESSNLANQPDYFVTTIDGHLNFRLSDRYISACLNAYATYLVNILNIAAINPGKNDPATAIASSDAISPTGDPTSPMNFPGYTHVQYAHARCAAMLQLSKDQGLADATAADFNWQLLDNHGDRSPRLWLQEKPEQQLIFTILQIGDRYFDPNLQSAPAELSSQEKIKLVSELTSSCLEFHDRCPVFGKNEAIAKARIGLFALTYKLIKSLASQYIYLPELL
jgi:hypothetical protein